MMARRNWQMECETSSNNDNTDTGTGTITSTAVMTELNANSSTNIVDNDDVTMIDTETACDAAVGGNDSATSRRRNKVSWLNFYKAVVNDDADTVREAVKYRDYRIHLEDGQSAIELAVKLGSTASVRVMIEHIQKELDSYEQYRVLVHACCSACNGGQTEMIKILLEAVRPQMAEFCESIHFLGIYEKAVEHGSQDLMHIIEEFTRIDIANMALIRRAFINGNRPLFMRLYDLGGRTPAELAQEMPVPVLLIYIALGDMDNISSSINSNPHWHETSAFGDDGNGNPNPGLNAFGVAGSFCDITILDLLYFKSHEENCTITNLDEILEKIYKHAMFHDGLEVIEWLIQRDFFEIKMPYEVDVECSHCYPHIDPDGRVFKYLEKLEYTCKLTAEARMTKILGVIGDVVAHGSEKLVDWYLNQTEMNENLALTCLKAAVANDRPLFVKRFLKLVEFSCDNLMEPVHELLRCLLQCTKKRNRRLPSPITFEIILKKLPKGSTCKCGESVLFDLFLDMDYAGGHSHRGEDILPFSLTCRHIRILMSQLVTHGARPKLRTVKRALFNFLSNTGASSLETCFGARIIWLCDWYDISELVKPFKIDQCAIWFIRKYEDRDTVLSEILQSFCGNRDIRIRWDGLLVYIMNPGERRRQFIKCINEFGLIIQDKYMTKVSDELKRTRAYKDVLELTKPRMLSLQSLSRITIYKYLRQKTTEIRMREDKFVPMCEVVSTWCINRCIPRQIVEFMTFKDCFHDWNDDIEPHIHESVRELVFDVTEVLFMHPQLRDNLDLDNE